MDLSNLNWDAGSSSGNFEILPVGDYLAMATDWKENTYNGKTNLEVTWTIVSGQYKGRLLWQTYRIGTGNTEKAINFSTGQISRWGKAVGIEKPANVGLLMNKPTMVTVGHNEYNGTVKPEITQYVKHDDVMAHTMIDKTQVDTSGQVPWPT